MNRNKEMFQLFMAALLVVMLVVATACSSNSENTPKSNNNESDNKINNPSKEPEVTTSVESDDKITLRFAWWLPEVTDFQKIGEAFTKLHPNVTFEYIGHPGTAEGGIQIITEAIAAGNPIDAFWHPAMTDLIEHNLIEDLTPYIEKDEEFKAYPFKPGINETFQMDGKQWGLSRGNDVMLMFYNKELLKQYGLEEPKHDWTWDDFREMAIKATDPEAKHWGLNNSLWFMQASNVMPVANGSAPRLWGFNEDLTKNLADGSVPEVLDDLQFFQDLMIKDNVLLNYARSEAAGVQPETLWQNGQALFTYTISPVIPGFKTLPFEWDVAPLPRGTAKQVTFGWNSGMFMAKATKHKEMVWEFLKFWAATKEGQKILMDIGGTFPNSDDPEIVEYFNNVAVYEGLNKEALNLSAEIVQFDPVLEMYEGAEFDKITLDMRTEVYQQEKSAYDYYPPRIEEFNRKLKEKLDSLQ
ncbi:sugar ABC transporter substrate-binding protein [Paenibacillus sp. J5C_2022]|uniref:ABC transporter substrate-binding protein n=1 Tax=Paenibacillus sp. J5C2022 TaxID=2977129 RepID=UPI0021CEDDC5|nr:sugar ABC transporter substrate-binding protein [Paenibacillus sp. J5C2022]MCU6710931.1 sugar ABC transporter substrate-binding protein [Paenibacillus sp. J5C2022]